MAKIDLKSKTKDELESMLEKFNKERMNLRFQKSMGQLENHQELKLLEEK